AVEFQLAWNDTWHRNHAAGKSVTFEIEYAGKVFAQVTTPSDSGPANYDATATVTGLNGATVDVDEVGSWTANRSTGDWWLAPSDLSGFETITVRLPIDVPADGDLVLRWVPDTAGGEVDDLMIANVKVLKAAPMPEFEEDTNFGMSAFAVDLDDESGESPSLGDEISLDADIAPSSMRMASFDIPVGEGQAEEESYSGLLDSEDDDWASQEFEGSADIKGSAARFDESDEVSEDERSVSQTGQESDSTLDEDLNLGEVLDELGGEDDLDEVLEAALGKQGSEASGGSDANAKRDLDAETQDAEDASRAPDAETVVSKKGDDAGPGQPSGPAADPSLDAEALAAQNELLQQLMNAGRPGNEGM